MRNGKKPSESATKKLNSGNLPKIFYGTTVEIYIFSLEALNCPLNNIVHRRKSSVKCLVTRQYLACAASSKTCRLFSSQNINI